MKSRPEAIDKEGPKLIISEGAALLVWESCKRSAAIEKLTNTQLAKRLINEVWAKIPMMCSESDLLSVVIDRLIQSETG